MFGAPGAITITITMSPDGKINVNGPLENKIVFFGLLEIAKETCTKYNDAAASGIVAPPPGLVIPKS